VVRQVDSVIHLGVQCHGQVPEELHPEDDQGDVPAGGDWVRAPPVRASRVGELGIGRGTEVGGATHVGQEDHEREGDDLVREEHGEASRVKAAARR